MRFKHEISFAYKRKKPLMNQGLGRQLQAVWNNVITVWRGYKHKVVSLWRIFGNAKFPHQTYMCIIALILNWNWMNYGNH
ncbi:hypothetical protein ECB94_03920 [Vibrio mediterranei]|uniref:Uncharacterized protein n=1 Tax=Vibrio mediterranei TaxID=689 RepID=A0A3G4VBF5_9VIBR|nr:hypothetical protein ECB94_03920 [Vibrio mediterranei]